MSRFELCQKKNLLAKIHNKFIENVSKICQNSKKLKVFNNKSSELSKNDKSNKEFICNCQRRVNSNRKYGNNNNFSKAKERQRGPSARRKFSKCSKGTTKAKSVLNHHNKSLANIAKLTTAKKLVKKNHKYSKKKKNWQGQRKAKFTKAQRALGMPQI